MSHDALNQVKSFTVQILIDEGDGKGFQLEGTGVVVRNDSQALKILTNEHVIRSAKRIKVKPESGVPVSATVEMKSANPDVALLSVSVSPAAASVLSQFGVASICPSSQLSEGDLAFTHGFPSGFDATSPGSFVSHAGRFFGDGSTGVDLSKATPNGVLWNDKYNFENSSLGLLGNTSEVRAIDGFALMHFAIQERGMSGGPTTDTKGCVIGLNGLPSHTLFGVDSLFKVDGRNVSRDEALILTRFSWSIPTNLFPAGFAAGEQAGVRPQNRTLADAKNIPPDTSSAADCPISGSARTLSGLGIQNNPNVDCAPLRLPTGNSEDPLSQ